MPHVNGDPAAPTEYVLNSRWSCEVPDIDIVSWLFTSPTEELSQDPLYHDAEKPDTHNLSLHGLRSLVRRIAGGLKAAGLQEGDRVLLFSSNNVFFPALYLGIVAAGGVFTGANPTYTPRELAFQLKDSGARFCVMNESFVETAVAAADQIGLPRSQLFVFDDGLLLGHLNGGGPDRWNKDGAAAKQKFGVRHWSDICIARDDFVWKTFTTREEANRTATINYSSGTTGVPKGVELSHRNLVANVSQICTMAHLSPEMRSLESRWIGVLPMYHAYGQIYYVMLIPALNIPLFVTPKFEFLQFLSYLQKYRITTVAAVPPILTAIAKHPAVDQYDLSSVRGLGSGAAPLAREIAKTIEGKFAKSGTSMRIRQGWGMTETTCSVLGHHPEDDSDDDGSVGELIPNCQAKIIDAETGSFDLPANQQGELVVRGPNVCKGYYNNPQATAETFTHDGWLKTGDLGYYNAVGKFYIVDRKKELIKVKGNQVAPAELEGVLLECPKIADVAVIGITFAGDERPRAYVVAKPDVTLAAEEVEKWVQDRCTRHKWITGGVVFIDEIPKNPSGKILRKILRERAKTEVRDTGDFRAKL